MLGQMGAMNMQMLVRGWLVFDLTGSYAALGVVALAQAVPQLTLSIGGGVIADRMPKKLVVQAGQAASVGVALAVAALLFLDVLVFWHLLVAGVVQGLVMAIMMPARQAMVPEVVGMDRMMNAVALNSAGMNLMRLLAPGLGGVLIAVIGPGSVYVLMAGLYAFSVVTLFGVPTHPPARPANGARRKGGFADLKSGLAYVVQDRTMFVLLTMNFITSLMAMPYLMLLPGFVKEVYGAGSIGLGVLITVSGAGALVGALVIASLPPKRRGLLLLLSAAFIGISLVAFASSDIYIVGLIAMVFVGVGSAGRQALGQVLLQQYVENEYRGRVMSVYMTQFSVMSVGVFLVGTASEVIGVQWAIGGLAGLLVVVTLVMLATIPRLRQLD